MRRLFDLWRRAGPVAAAAVPDGDLLRRFARHRDDDAFAQLLARHGPLVYGACRRLLPDPLDVEDAFQATFLVLVRRADTVAGRPLGPWLHRVAVWTARNLRRRNAARLAATAPLGEPAATPQPADARLDVDAALAALPGKYRVPVILCHLQGWTRRELAAHLGCPESTASSLVGRGLAKLRKRLDGRDPSAALATAAVPATLAAATARAAHSFPTAAVSPAVAALTNGVLRMFWVKKLAAAGAVLAVAVAAALGVGLAGDAPPAAPDDPAGERKRVEQELDAAKKRVAELEAKRKELADAETATPRLVVTVYGGKVARFEVTEYGAGGKLVGSFDTTSVELLARFVRRTGADPGGPKAVLVMVSNVSPATASGAVLAAFKGAGFREVAVRMFAEHFPPDRPLTRDTPPPAAAAPAERDRVIGFFQGWEPYPVVGGPPSPGRGERRGLVISNKKEGGTHRHFPLADDAVVAREGTGETLALKDLEVGQLVHLYRAAGPAANPPVVRIGVPDVKPPYVIEPPDVLTVEAAVRAEDEKGGAVTRPLPLQPVAGHYLVRPDGTVGLGAWGSVSVTGLTPDQAAGAVRKHLATRPRMKDADLTADNLVVTVAVAAANSKRYYVVVDRGAGEQVSAFPYTGTETVLDVLDALGQISDAVDVAASRVWVRRKGEAGKPDQALPVDWAGITRGGNTATNYQLRPGDRVYVKPKK